MGLDLIHLLKSCLNETGLRVFRGVTCKLVSESLCKTQEDQNGLDLEGILVQV